MKSVVRLTAGGVEKKIRKILTFPLINVRVQPGGTTLEVTAGVELIPKLRYYNLN